MLAYDVTVEGNKLHLHYDVKDFRRSQLEKIRASPYKRIGVVFHLHNGTRREVYNVASLNEISPTRFTVPFLDFKSPFGYISPYAVGYVSRSSELMNRSTDRTISQSLLWASNMPFSHRTIKEEAQAIRGLGKFIIRIEDIPEQAIIFGNNISFGLDAIGFARKKRTLKKSILGNLLHELDHGFEASVGMDTRPGGLEEHMAEYFAMLAPNEAPGLVKLYAPAIDYLAANARDGMSFSFDAGTGEIFALDVVPPSPFHKIDRTLSDPAVMFKLLMSNTRINELYQEIFIKKRSQEEYEESIMSGERSVMLKEYNDLISAQLVRS